jgi:hypothetical protein
MTPDEKNWLIHVALFWVFMMLIASEWMFGWPTNDQLTYICIAWLTSMCWSSLYVWCLESRQE